MRLGDQLEALEALASRSIGNTTSSLTFAPLTPVTAGFAPSRQRHSAAGSLGSCTASASAPSVLRSSCR